VREAGVVVAEEKAFNGQGDGGSQGVFARWVSYRKEDKEVSKVHNGSYAKCPNCQKPLPVSVCVGLNLTQPTNRGIGK